MDQRQIAKNFDFLFLYAKVLSGNL